MDEYLKNASPDEVAKYLKSLKNAGGLPLVNNNYQEEKVRLLVRNSVSPAMFIPHESIPNTYYANSTTIRALKKDIFMAGEGFEDLEDITNCESCSAKLDRQFWHFCPHCEAKLP